MANASVDVVEDRSSENHQWFAAMAKIFVTSKRRYTATGRATKAKNQRLEAEQIRARPTLGRSVCRRWKATPTNIQVRRGLSVQRQVGFVSSRCCSAKMNSSRLESSTQLLTYSRAYRVNLAFWWRCSPRYQPRYVMVFCSLGQRTCRVESYYI